MAHDYLEKYTFICEMYDDMNEAIVDLLLNFFPYDNSVEVINSKKGNIFLKRVRLPHLTKAMLRIGNVLNIFSKLLLIRDCAPATQTILFDNCERAFLLIKPSPSELHGKIISFIMSHGFQIVKMKNGKITKDIAMQMYQHISSNSMMPTIVDYVTSGDVIGLEVVGLNAVSNLRACVGATEPREAAVGTLRHLYGENIIKNAVHCCSSAEDAQHILEKFFGCENGVPRMPFSATFKQCTCCVVKPHVLMDGNLGALLQHIASAGAGQFRISCMGMFAVSVTRATEFYEVYKGVLPEYKAMCVHLAEGRCIALEVKSVDASVEVVSAFRRLCGPRDPELCRQLYPDSIRARFGKSILHNAVHCSDLPEDGPLEVEYFFKSLATQRAPAPEPA